MADGAPSIERTLIPRDATLKTAMKALTDGARGLVLIYDDDMAVIGAMTDGDVRNSVLKQGNMDAPVALEMNTGFIFAEVGVSRERILKLLDSRIRAIPILDEKRRLVDIVTLGSSYAEPQQKRAIAHARAPIRLSLAGGGTDFTNVFMQHGGVSLTATIARYCRATLRVRDDGNITIYSHDFGQSVEAGGLDDLAYDGCLDLIKAGIRVMRPEFGFDLQVGSDFLPGSGVGGSAAVLATVIGCLNEISGRRLDRYAIAEHAFEAERLELAISGGWQDQYSTVFGGFNVIEFNSNRNIVMPLRLETTTLRELEARFLFCYSGRPHSGPGVYANGDNGNGVDGSNGEFSERLKQIAEAMRSRLLRGDFDDFGALMHETWLLKKQHRENASNATLDEIYQVARDAGADGGRLLGTGGGGYFVFCVKPMQRYQVMDALGAHGLSVDSVVFDMDGLQSWRSAG